jgi:hypothetical protein
VTTPVNSTTPAPARPRPSGRFAADLTVTSDVAVNAGDGSARTVPEPANSPVARWWTLLLGLVFIAGGAAVVREILVVKGSIDGDEWFRPAFSWLADLSYRDWMLPAAIGCAVVALIFLLVTVKPRARTHMALTGTGQDAPRVFARPVDIARLTTATTEQVPGVLRATTVTTRKKITVTVVTAAAPDEHAQLTDRVTVAATGIADLVDPSPTVAVKLVHGDPATTGGRP